MSWLHKRSVRVLGVILLVALLAVVGVKLFLPAEKIRDLALNQARTALGREVTVAEVNVSLRGGLGVRLIDLAVANPAGFGGESLLMTDGVDLKLALRPLFKGEIRVHRLVIEKPVVNLIRRADGSDNFTFAPAPGAASAAAADEAATGPPPLSVANLTIQDGRLRFTDESAAAPGLQEVALNGLSLGLSLTDPGPGRYDAAGRLTVAEITMKGPEQLPPLRGDVDFELGWDAAAESVDLRRADLVLLEIPIACTGQIVVSPEGATGSLALKAIDVPVQDLLAFLPPDLAVRVAGKPMGGVLTSTIAMDLTGEKEVPVRLEGKASLRDFDLAAAQPFLPPEQAGQLGGQCSAEVDFAGDLGAEPRLTYEGTAEASGVSYTESGLVDDLQDLSAALRFNADMMALDRCRARFKAGTMDLTGTLRDPFPYFLPVEMQAGKQMKTPHLEFKLSTPRLDVDRWLPAASPSSATPTAGGGRQPDPRREIPAGLEFPDLTGNGTFTADTLIYMQVPLTAIQGNVKVADRLLKVQEVTGTAYNGKVAGQIDIDLKNLQEPVYAGKYQAQNIEVNNFATRFAGLVGVVFGAANLNGSFTARGLDPEVIRNGLSLDADAGIADGKVMVTGNSYDTLSQLAAQAGQSLDHEQKLRDFATHISVKEGRVHLNALTTKLGSLGDFTMDGYYGFNGDLKYNGSLLLTNALTDALFSRGVMAELGKLLGNQRPQRLALPLSVGGTRTKPAVKLDLGGVTDDLQKKIVSSQGEKLEDEAKKKLGDLLKKWR